MALSVDELTAIDGMLSASDAGANLYAELRKRFPHLSVTRCDASDVAETPFRSYPQFEIHLLNSADHCSQITADPALATGIILAKRGKV